MCGAGMSPHNPLLSGDVDAAFVGAARLRRRLLLLGLHDDMRTVYASADVVSLTSGFGEAAPLCLIEGAMCGAVPVATDVGDCASIVDGRGLITPADPEVIAAAWAETLDRRVEFATALAAGRERFSQTRMIAAYAALIERTRDRVAVPRLTTRGGAGAARLRDPTATLPRPAAGPPVRSTTAAGVGRSGRGTIVRGGPTTGRSGRDVRRTRQAKTTHPWGVPCVRSSRSPGRCLSSPGSRCPSGVCWTRGPAVTWC
jgi:hypothetical protein